MPGQAPPHLPGSVPVSGRNANRQKESRKTGQVIHAQEDQVDIVPVVWGFMPRDSRIHCKEKNEEHKFGHQ